MKVVTIYGDPIPKKDDKLRSYVCLQNRRTGQNFTLAEYVKITKATVIDLKTWRVSSFATKYIDDETRAKREMFTAKFRQEWGDHPCYDEPCIAFYYFLVKIPESFSLKRKKELLGTEFDKRPDEGNYTYFVDNRLERIAFKDDKCIAIKVARKIYACTPATIIGVGSIADLAMVSLLLLEKKNQEIESQRSLLC